MRIIKLSVHMKRNWQKTLNRILSFYAYVSSKRTVANKVGPLKNSNGGAVSNNKVAADILNTHFSSVFAKEDLANVREPKRVFNSAESEIFSSVDIT